MKNGFLKRALSLLCIVAMLISTLAACSAEAPEEAAPAPESASEEAPAEDAEAPADAGASVLDGATLSAFFVQTQYIDQLDAMLTAIQADTGLTIDAQVVPDEQGMTMINMQAATDELNDITYSNCPGLFTNVNPAEDFYDLSNESWAADLVDPSVVSYEGSVYAYPTTAFAGYHSMIYNKDLFDEHGLSIPETNEDFIALCDELMGLGITPILQSGDSWVPQIWMSSGFSRALGSDEASQAAIDAIIAGEATFNDYPEFAAAIDEWLSYKKYMNDDLATMTWDDTWNRLSDGDGAMVLGEGMMITGQQPNYPDTNFGVFNVPVSYDTADTLSGAKYAISFAVAKNSENVDVALALFNEMAKEEYANMFHVGNPGFPALSYVDGGEMQEDIRALYDEYQARDAIVAEANVMWSAINPLLNSVLWVYYAEAINQDAYTGTEIMDMFQGDVEKYLSELEG